MFKFCLLSDYESLLPNIAPESIDFICIDPPYGKTNGMKLDGQKAVCDWDIQIDWVKMFKLFNVVLKKGGTIAVFGQNPTYSSMIQANLKQYKYEYVWIKNNCAQGYHADKMPLIFTENIAIFIKNGTRTFHKPSRPKMLDKNEYYTRWYAQSLLNFMNTTSREVHKKLGHRRLEFFFFFTGSLFTLCSATLYQTLIDVYGIDKAPFFIPFVELKAIWDNEKGDNKNKIDSLLYSKATRNVLMYDRDKPSLHTTQKPLKLMETLIKSHTNENDIVLDCFAGSGSTLVAAKRLNRRYIGCDVSIKYAEIATKRLQKEEENE